MTGCHIDFLSQVITRESLSTQICSSCVHKLRISYQFQDMCKKSTAILQQYLTELLSASDEISADKFLNSELTITTKSTLPKPRRKRVGKDERCSLLKKLLSRITREQIVHNIHIHGLAKLCDKIPSAMNNQPRIEKPNIDVSLQKLEKQKENNKSCGLRNLLDFTKDFDFGYDLSTDRNCTNNNFDLTPLEQLAKFTQSFFYDHFGDYRETILHVDDNVDFDSSDDEKMFEENFAETRVIKEEIVIVEPDLNLKKEMFYDESEDADVISNYDFTSRFVQACYDNGQDIKSEIQKDHQIIKQESEDNECDNEEYNYISHVAQNDRLAEIIPIPPPSSVFATSHKDPTVQRNTDYPLTMNLLSTPSSIHSPYLKQLEDTQMNYKRHRTLSPYSVKCRTRGNPFINPQLKKQFQTRNFKCSTCSRRFKSPGYLKAHCSKLKH